MIPKHEEARGLAIAAGLPRRLVLDTNVCLDLFVFRDPRWTALLSALRQSQVQAFTRADCRMEWTLVLAYARLGLSTAQQAAALAEFDQLTSLAEMSMDIDTKIDTKVGSRDASKTVQLPVCRDTDDQKFIELAATIGADALVTKDKLLLKLARKTRKLALFRILSPEQWTAEWSAAGAALPQ